MKLRHLRVLRNARKLGEPETPAAAASASDAPSIREELQRCKELMKQQRFVIAKYETVLRRQRRLVTISYTITLGVLVIAGLAVATRLGWIDLGRYIP